MVLEFYPVCVSLTKINPEKYAENAAIFLVWVLGISTIFGSGFICCPMCC